VAWNLIATLLNKRRWNKQKEQNRRERARHEKEVLCGYDDQIQEETWRQLAKSYGPSDLGGLKAGDLLANVALHGESAVVEELDRRYPDLEFKRTWGQTRGRIRRDLYLDLTRRAVDRTG
jgi:hypothetical protein